MFPQLTLLLLLGYSHFTTAVMPSEAISNCETPQNCHVIPPTCRDDLPKCRTLVWLKKKDKAAMSIGLFFNGEDNFHPYVGIGYSTDGKMVGSVAEICFKDSDNSVYIADKKLINQNTFRVSKTGTPAYVKNLVKKYDVSKDVLSCQYDREFIAASSDFSLESTDDFIHKKYRLVAVDGAVSSLKVYKHKKIGLFADYPTTTSIPTTTTRIPTTTTRIPTTTSRIPTTTNTTIPLVVAATPRSHCLKFSANALSIYILAVSAVFQLL